MKKTKWLYMVPFLLLLLGSCGKPSGERLDTPTGGHVRIAVDESLQPLLEAEIKAFEGLYRQAKIDVSYVPEAVAAELLVKDSVRLAILCRKPDAREEGLIRQVNILPTATKLASDGIALIVHPDNPDTLISYQQLQALLQGQLSRWQDLGTDTSGIDGAIQLVFDNERSSTLRYLQDSLGLKVDQPNFFALEDNRKVLEYVAQNPQAMGVIGLSWISDSDDPAVQFSLKNIKVMAVSDSLQRAFYQPYQGCLAQGSYPLLREVYVVSREARAGLGSGFTAFLANEIGQRVVLKAGLLPATMPIRLVQIAAEPAAAEE